ncbi:uncharacterized protein LOC129170266 isoform X3 [Dunckerocampus dactyliophorus]|uniref:uncharacterized protein LOC129170266 isoform X3 n=1 Tax=Dunckerocampus dactyliophorus TaxID=161453 RepID=UPI0024050504|nr:uncharacterized protein LOC129170266 isoform X3 [Dunckerocampus dactyliophorus]
MCKVQMLRALVNQRLTTAVEEIFVVLERTIAEYEEELSRTKEENERQRQILDAVFKKPRVVLYREEVSAEHLPPDHEEPQPPHVKEEENDHSISQEKEHLEGLEEFPGIGVPVKTEDDEDKGESEEKRGGESPSSLSTQHMTTEADGDHRGGSQADNRLAPLSDNDNTTSLSPDTDDEGRGGMLEPIPADFGRQAGYTLDWWPANRRAHIDKQPFTLTFIPMDNLESAINLTCMFLGMWEEAGVPRENPHTHGENMQTPHRNALGRI